MSSKYVVPTGPGYQGRYSLADYSLKISIGVNTCVDWTSADTVYCREDPTGGLAIVEDPHAGRYISQADVRKEGVGTVVQVPARAVRELAVSSKGDVRVYARDEGGLLVVPAENDPMVSAEGSA